MTNDMTAYDRWDQFMYLLSDQVRRQIIVSLMNAPDQQPLPLPEAAITPDLPTDTDRLEIKLRQIHVPVLVEANYIESTDDPFQIRRGDRFEEPAAVMGVLLSSSDQLPPSVVKGCVEEPHDNRSY